MGAKWGRAMNSKIKNALLYICDNLGKYNLLWALTGSTSFNLQGINININDIDVQTDKNSAYKFEKIFRKYVIKPVKYSLTDKIRSHFGIFEIRGVKVEVMGDIQKRLPDDKWEKNKDLKNIIDFVNFEGYNIPVLNLAYEEKAYRILGRIERADLIKKHLKSNM